MTKAAGCIAGIMFLCLASVKLARGYDSSFSVGWTVYYLAVSFELVVGLLYLGGRIALASSLGICFFLVAATFTALGPPGPCGCLGGIDALESREMRAVISGLGGLLCLSTLYVASPRDKREEALTPPSA